MKLLRTKATRKPVLVLLLAAAMPAALALHGCKREAGIFKKEPVDAAKWAAVNFRCPSNRQTYAKWVVSADRQTVRQVINGDPSILVSDRDLEPGSFSGTWLVGANDDDFVGFVFGYQNPGKFYLFDWKGGPQHDGAMGLARQGMCLKIAEAPYDGPMSGNLEAGKPFAGKDLWQTEGSEGRVRLLDYEATEPWQPGKPYRFQLNFRPGEFRITVIDGQDGQRVQRVIYDKTFQDSTYPGGKFGFYNYSQGGVVYRGFQTTEIPGKLDYPWLTILLILLVLGVLITAKKKQPREPAKGKK